MKPFWTACAKSSRAPGEWFRKTALDLLLAPTSRIMSKYCVTTAPTKLSIFSEAISKKSTVSDMDSGAPYLHIQGTTMMGFGVVGTAFKLVIKDANDKFLCEAYFKDYPMSSVIRVLKTTTAFAGQTPQEEKTELGQVLVPRSNRR